jgi:hypothetical protein
MGLDQLLDDDETPVAGAEDGAEQEQQTEDPYQDLEEISKRIDGVINIDRFQRTLIESEWFRNVLFYVGQQWIIREKQRWRPKALPLWYPKAQTNKFAEKANDLISTIMQGGRVPIRYVPATGDPADEATAEVGERVREVIYSEAKIDDKEAELATWLVLTGNVFLIPYYDLDEKHGMSSVPMQQCDLCNSVISASDLDQEQGMCPTCTDMGQANTAFSPAADPQGNPMVEQFPIGAIAADVVSPFEIRLDHRIRDFADHRRYVRVRRYDVDFAKEKWDEYKDKITSSNDVDTSEYYLDVLSQVTSSFGASNSNASSAAPNDKKQPKVTAYEINELPSEKFPEGLHAIRIGTAASNIVEAGPLTSEYGAGVLQGQKFLNLIHFGFDTIPGRFWKKTRMDDLIPLQIFRNTIEANLRLTVQRMGNGIWLNPKGSGAENLTGEPGQNVTYNPVSLGGTSFAKPERVAAELSNIQPLIIMINKIDDSMERVAGTFFLQGGDTPPGVTAASALAYLGERAQKSMSPFLREWAKGWKRFDEQALEIARANWDDDRIRVIAGKNKKWQVEKFRSSSLQGAVNMEIDYQSLFPKSQATERATLSQLVQFGVVNPQDPEQQYRILQKFGMTEMKGSVDLDVQEAVKEADRFLSKDEEPELVPMVQNSVIHLMQHNDFAKTDEFKELSNDKKQQWYMHIQATVADIVARQVAFSAIGVDPNNPALAEMGSGEANLAQQAMAQAGGVPNGAEGPDPRLTANGSKPMPPKPGQTLPPDQGTNDIAMPPGVRNIQAPREVSPDQQVAQ